MCIYVVISTSLLSQSIQCKLIPFPSPLSPLLSAGQFWNRDVELENFTGTLNPNYPPLNQVRYTLNVNNRTFTGILFDLTWEFKPDPCILAGNRQAGPIGEVLEPNEPVIEGNFREYKIGSLFGTAFTYGRFNEDMCGDGSGVPFTANNRK